MPPDGNRSAPRSEAPSKCKYNRLAMTGMSWPMVLDYVTASEVKESTFTYTEVWENAELVYTTSSMM